MSHVLLQSDGERTIVADEARRAAAAACRERSRIKADQDVSPTAFSDHQSRRDGHLDDT